MPIENWCVCVRVCDIMVHESFTYIFLVNVYAKRRLVCMHVCVCVDSARTRSILNRKIDIFMYIAGCYIATAGVIRYTLIMMQ